MGQIKMSPSVVFKFLASETPENYILFFVLIMFFKINSWDFPGRPMAKTQGFHHKEPRFHPWSGEHALQCAQKKKNEKIIEPHLIPANQNLQVGPRNLQFCKRSHHPPSRPPPVLCTTVLNNHLSSRKGTRFNLGSNFRSV